MAKTTEYDVGDTARAKIRGKVHRVKVDGVWARGEGAGYNVHIIDTPKKLLEQGIGEYGVHARNMMPAK